MTEITFKGGPIHLKGQQINEGDLHLILQC